MQDLHQMAEGDVNTIAKNLAQILEISEGLANGGIAPGFKIYQLARDTLEVLAFDRIGRDTLARLNGRSEPEMFQDYVVHPGVAAFLLNDELIHAIKAFRKEYPETDLKTAKHWCDAYREHLRRPNAF
jgi:hypothetical protein